MIANIILCFIAVFILYHFKNMVILSIAIRNIKNFANEYTLKIIRRLEAINEL